MQKIKPCGHRVLVKLKVIEEVSTGGILLVTDDKKASYQKAMQEAYVVAIGPQAFTAFNIASESWIPHLYKLLKSFLTREPLTYKSQDLAPWCKVGDLVLIARYSGEDKVDPDTEEVFRIINDEDIFATLED